MVSFRTIFTAALALTPIAAQITPSQVVDNIKVLTAKSQQIQAPALSISIINGPLLIIGQGPFPVIIAGFADIVTTATVAITQMQGMSPVASGPPSDAIFDAFREFVRVHQVLLNILIGKAGLFQTVPFIGAPVAGVLRQIENVVDTIAIGLIKNVQSRANDLQTQANALSGTLTIAIQRYNGISTGSKRSLKFARRETAAAVEAAA
ncbi:UVI-1 [Phaeosphaeriaceae sp. PMI808]|nr:UVI-1 [Phaeosphaeriaceae sp. PMI808]